ncbi:hypothetical protein NPIL_94041 [Nephila pilipes]|uniref:Uncharacterized protein n=1 Tax=Nephila pilipes TaxID=299642 RepID=A0A8X6MWY0_NEPPI|nr:hypothetical protein NPIL_94041 [Nephila pilipes]
MSLYIVWDRTPPQRNSFTPILISSLPGISARVLRYPWVTILENEADCLPFSRFDRKQFNPQPFSKLRVSGRQSKSLLSCVQFEQRNHYFKGSKLQPSLDRANATVLPCDFLVDFSQNEDVSCWFYGFFRRIFQRPLDAAAEIMSQTSAFSRSNDRGFESDASRPTRGENAHRLVSPKSCLGPRM